MDLESFELDESTLAEAEQRREAKLAEDETPIVADNDCDSGACFI